MNKKIITILIIILVVAIAGGFWYANNQNNVILNSFQNLNNNLQESQRPENQNNVIPEKSGIQEEQNSETISQNNQDIEELKIEEIDTSNWKEYCNEEYGFCLKYPRDWEYRDITKDENVFSIGFGERNKYYEIEGGGDNAVNVFVISKPENSEYVPQILQVWKKNYNITINKIVVDDLIGYYYSGFGEGVIFPSVFKKNEIKIVSDIMTTSDVKNEIKPILQNMIKSIKFTK